MQDQHRFKHQPNNQDQSFFSRFHLPLIPTVIVSLAIALIAFVAGNRLPLLHWSDLAQIGHKSQVNGQLDLGSVSQLYSELQKYYDGKLDANTLTTGLKKGLVNATGDPYTEYFTAEEAKQFNDELEGNFSGIGIEIGSKNKSLVVIAPVDGTPAQKAGIKAGDTIVAVDGKDATTWTVSEAANKIRGQAGSKVKLTIQRGNQTLNYEITRANITVPSVKYSIIGGQIGYLQISRFGDDTVGLAQKAAQDFKDHHVKGVILDLRNNGGGLLDAAVGVSSLWLNNKVVVSEKTGGVTKDTLRSNTDAPLEGTPTLVLVNGGSASASEITAGALHDNGAAKLLGEKTFGKGSVQEVIKLKDGGELKVTVAHWYTPDGVNINKEGIQPDIKVALTDVDYNSNKDPQKAAALKLLEK